MILMPWLYYKESLHDCPSDYSTGLDSLARPFSKSNLDIVSEGSQQAS